VLALAQQQLQSSAAQRALRLAGSADFSPADLDLLRLQLEAEGITTAVEHLIARQVSTALAALNNSTLHPDGIAQLTLMAHQIAWRDR